MKLPESIKQFQDQFQINYRNLLSVNPKTEKSEVDTRILHLLPHDLSGVNLCPGAGNCKKVCLHFAGNPTYHANKTSARKRKTLAFLADHDKFMALIVMAIIYEWHKNGRQKMAVRLNGTSDIAFEYIQVMITSDVSNFILRKFGIDFGPGGLYQNVFECLQVAGIDVQFYDYTKVKRNWNYCKELNYHLTVSFDGYNNESNIKIVRDALQNGVNVAAAFTTKKGKRLPTGLYIPVLGIEHPVYDGDVSDYRPNDPQGYIIGLRFKKPTGTKFEPGDVAKFCIA